MPELKRLLKELKPLDYLKLSGLAFGFGLTVARMEYKYDSSVQEIKALVQVHITESAKQDEIFELKLGDVKKDVDNNTKIINQLTFLRPEDIRPRRIR